MAELAQLESALVKADAAGDAEGARVLATEVRRMRSESAPAVPPAPTPTEKESSLLGNIASGAGNRGAGA